jgi:HAE1 family hydrophobic/amphiphilic exporter-1
LKTLASVRSEVQSGNKEYRVVIDRIKAKQLGFTPDEVARNLAVGIRGMQLRPIQGAEHEINLFVEFQKKDRRNLSNLREFQLFKDGQEPVSLSALARFIPGSGPSNIDRFDRVTSLNLQVDPKREVTREEARDEINQALKGFRFPPGYGWSFGRSFNFAEEAAQTMLINTFLALALIYFVMAALFESLIMPAAIWTSIIFAIVGVWWFFLITGTVFDLMAWIGILILIGVVVNNGIVLIDYTNQLRQRGIPRHEALIKAGGDRLRPILMTASTTVFSLVPLCLTKASIGGDGPPYYPMARAIVGGLVFSTLVTLIFLPSVYVMLDNLRIRAKGLYKKWFFFLNRDEKDREAKQPATEQFNP